MTEKSDILKEIATRISNCEKCPLHCTRTNTVPGTGNSNAEVVFVGEAPGEEEDKTGLPFVGKSGQLLTKMIEAMGIYRADIFIVNVNKCRPPGNRQPTTEEMAVCSPFLEEQIKAIKPKALCALGKTAAIGLGLIKPEEALGPKRGKIYEWNGIPVVLTYHPSYLLRSPGEKTKAWQDLKMLFPYISNREVKL